MVGAIDYSIVEALQNLKLSALQHDCILLYANLDQNILSKMIAAGVLNEVEYCEASNQTVNKVVFETLNDALDWCSLEATLFHK